MYLWRHLYDKIYLFHRSRNLANKHLDGIGIGGRRVGIHCCLAHQGEVSLARAAHHLHHQQRWKGLCCDSLHHHSLSFFLLFNSSFQVLYVKYSVVVYVDPQYIVSIRYFSEPLWKKEICCECLSCRMNQPALVQKEVWVTLDEDQRDNLLLVKLTSEMSWPKRNP